VPRCEDSSFTTDSERGSALMLVPVAFVITVILAAFAMNSALTFLAHQELSRAARTTSPRPSSARRCTTDLTTRSVSLPQRQCCSEMSPGGSETRSSTSRSQTRSSTATP
jgi:hypothetical protein